MTAVRGTYLILRNELLVTIRDPMWLFRGMVQPVIYLVLFAPLLDGVSHVPGFPARGAIGFFAPGLLIMNAMFGAGFEGFTLRDKVLTGFLERLRVTPVSRVALALGFILASSVTLVFQSCVLVLCALAFGLRTDPLGLIALLALIVLIGITMAALSYCLGLMTREGGVLASVINTYVLPLTILSGVMLPISFGPPVIQFLARLDPFYYAVNAARALIGGAPASGAVALAFILFAATSAAALALFVRTMRNAVA